MLKLYKNSKTYWQYWEAWEHHRELTIHQGKLGHNGASYRVPLHFWQKAKSAIERIAASLRARGFREIPIDQHTELMVQYRTPTWGAEADPEKRYRSRPF